jgi:hypothetical protein
MRRGGLSAAGRCKPADEARDALEIRPVVAQAARDRGMHDATVDVVVVVHENVAKSGAGSDSLCEIPVLHTRIRKHQERIAAGSAG